MGINNYNNLNVIANAFGVELKDSERVEKLNKRINAYAELQSMRRDPDELADMLLAADEKDWPTILKDWAPVQAMGEAIKAISHRRIGEQMKRERAAIVDTQRWHYLAQIPLAQTIAEFVDAIERLGEHVGDANAAMLAGKGAAASTAHEAEQKLLTLKEFTGVSGTRHAAFTAMLVEPPTLPPLYRRSGDDWSIGVTAEDRATEQLHRAAKEVRDRAIHGLRDIAAGHHNIAPTENTPGVTFVMSAPADENDYLQRINDWESLAIYRKRT